MATTNVSNTGVRKISKATSGATGSVTNTISTSSIQGASGALAPVVIDRTPDIDSMVRTHTSAANAHAQAATSEAYSRAEGHLAQARQQALGAVPAEYRDRVNQHFDRAAEQISNMRKKRLGD